MVKFRGWKGNTFHIGRMPVFRIVKRRLRRGWRITVKQLDQVFDLREIRSEFADSQREADIAVKRMKRTISYLYRRYFR